MSDLSPAARQPAGRAPTRIVALGTAMLMDGFRLAGIEVVADATREDLEHLLQGLLDSHERALVLVESGLACEPGPWLARARAEGGRVVVVRLPPLNRPHDYRHEVDDLIGTMATDPGDPGSHPG